MDSAKTLGQVFEYRNMKKAAILDPNAQKNGNSGQCQVYFEKNIEKNLFLKRQLFKVVHSVETALLEFLFFK